MTENHENHGNCSFFYMWGWETSATLPKLLRNLGFNVGKVNETVLPQIVGFTAQKWPKKGVKNIIFWSFLTWNTLLNSIYQHQHLPASAPFYLCAPFQDFGKKCSFMLLFYLLCSFMLLFRIKAVIQFQILVFHKFLQQ